MTGGTPARTSRAMTRSRGGKRALRGHSHGPTSLSAPGGARVTPAPPITDARSAATRSSPTGYPAAHPPPDLRCDGPPRPTTTTSVHRRLSYCAPATAHGASSQLRPCKSTMKAQIGSGDPAARSEGGPGRGKSGLTLSTLVPGAGLMRSWTDARASCLAQPCRLPFARGSLRQSGESGHPQPSRRQGRPLCIRPRTDQRMRPRPGSDVHTTAVRRDSGCRRSAPVCAVIARVDARPKAAPSGDHNERAPHGHPAHEAGGR